MLEITHVTKKYTNDKKEYITALDDVSLVFPDTGFVVVTGTSGCGKTTLLNILGGLDRPTIGEVRLDGVRIDDKDEKWWDFYRSSCLGFVYQDFNLLDNMTVKENIRLPLALQNIDEKTKEDRICKISDILGLNEYLGESCGKLSGGQKQRVAVARALVTGAKIILADEPTGNLDKRNSENVFKLMKKVSKTRLVVVVTHDTSLAGAYADQLIQITYGKIECGALIEKNIPNSRKDTFLNHDLIVKAKNKKFSIKECLGFAGEVMKKRKMRCLVSIMIFTITMLFILVLCEALFRDDSIPIAEYISDSDQKVIPLFTEVPDAYINITENDKITSGKNFYDLICRCTDEGRIVQCGNSCNVEFTTGKFKETQIMYVDMGNEKYFTYEGKFPEKEDEIAVSEKVVEEFGNYQSIIGTGVFIGEKKYTITAIVSELCGKYIENIHVDDGAGGDMLENVILLSTKALTDKTVTSGVYMSGFGVTAFSNMFYQTTIYNEIHSVEDEIELISGRMPEKDNEILISQSLLEQRSQTDKDVVGRVYKMNNLYGKQYGRAYWNMVNLYDYMGKEMTIVGVADGPGDYFVTNSVYEKIYEEYKTYCEQSYCLLIDDKQLQNDLQLLLENNVKIKEVKYDKVYMLMNTIDSMKTAMVIIVTVIALLSVLQMISLYSYSINDNKKTIGILRTLGVNKSDTKKIFTVECIAVSVSSFAIAIIINVFITHIINSIISQQIIELDNFCFLRMRFIVVLVTGVVSVVLSIFSVIIPLRKYSKIKIIELIK